MLHWFTLKLEGRVILSLKYLFRFLLELWDPGVEEAGNQHLTSSITMGMRTIKGIRPGIFIEANQSLRLNFIDSPPKS